MNRILPHVILFLLLMQPSLQAAGSPNQTSSDSLSYETLIRGLSSQSARDIASQFRSRHRNEASNPWWQLGLGRCLLFEQPDAKEGRRLLEKAATDKSTEALAWHYLGCSYLDQGFSGEKRAWHCFEKALKADPAHTATYLKMVEIKESQRLYPNESVELLGKALIHNPGTANIYVLFLEKAYYFHALETGRKYLEKLALQNPGNVQYDLDRANFLMLEGDTAESGWLLRRAVSKLSEKQRFQHGYLSAIHGFLTHDAQAELHYWQAIALLSYAPDLQRLIKDLRYVMKPPEWRFIENESLDVQAFAVQFWNQRDPAPLTVENERLPLYYRQLYQVRRYCRRYSTLRPQNIAFGKMDIDDMGQVLLRHGEPDSRITDQLAGEEGAPRNNLSFVYYGHNGKPERHYHFRHDPIQGRGWILTPLPASFKQREQLGGEFALLEALEFKIESILGNHAMTTPGMYKGTTADEFINRELASLGMHKYETFTSMINKNFPDLVHALTTETDGEIRENTLFLPFTPRLLHDDDGRNILQLYHLIEGSQVAVNTDSTDSCLDLSYCLTFRDSSGTLLNSTRFDRCYPLNIDEEIWTERSVVLMEATSLPKGRYDVDLHVLDNNSGRTAVAHMKTDTRRVDTSELALSDFILSSPLEPGDDEDRFSRKGWKIQPHMFKAYKLDESIGLYGEVYNLTLDETGQSRYKIAWSLITPDGSVRKVLGKVFKSLRNHEQSTVASEAQYSGRQRNEVIALNLDFDRPLSGPYQLRIVVTDEISGRECQADIPITVEISPQT